MSYRIADLILAKGDADARGQYESAQHWANAVSNIGQTFAQVPGQIQAGREAQRAKQATQQQATAERELFANGMPTPDQVLGVYGPERGLKVVQGMQALSDLQGKRTTDARDTAGRLALGLKQFSPEMRRQVWPTVKQAAITGGLAQELPDDPDDQFLDGVIAWATNKAPEAPKPKPTRTVTTKDASGRETTQIVEDVPGQTFTSEAPAVPPWKPGASGISPQERLALSLGYKDPATGRPMTEKLTEAQANAADRRAAAATRFTDGGGSTDQVWVIRDGKPTPIKKGTAQPGDTPYDAVAVRQAQPNNADDAKSTTEDAIGLLDQLESDPGFNRIYGRYEMRGWTQPAKDADAIRRQVVNALALPNLGALKGPMSDKDVSFVKNISSRLEDPNISEPAAKKAIQEAREFLERKLGYRVPKGGRKPVPPDVESALKAAGPGLHTGNDGTQWMVGADGSIRRVK